MDRTTTWTASDKPRRGGLVVGVLLAILLLGGGWYVVGVRGSGGPAKAQVPAQPPPVPVTVAAVARQDVPLWLPGIGSVQALNTVTVRSRVDGELQKIFFTEGQEVSVGDPLAQIDPRPFQATLDQATAKKAQDEAQLANAQRDLARYETLAQRDFSSRQQGDTQRAQVAQLQAQIKGDQATIDNAQVQLGYTMIRSPVNGRVGFRNVDAGNIVHANDTSGIVTVTQTHPINVVFTLPEDQLHGVVQAMARSPLAVSVNSRDNREHLADGVLKLVDNQVDQTTGTIRLKAEFPNTDNALWPGAFVQARLLLRTDTGVLTVPPNAVQRGPNGLYVYVVKPDGTAELRPVQSDRLGEREAVIRDGLQEGERVVVSGHLKIQPGTRVEARTADGKAPAAAPALRPVTEAAAP